MKLRAIASVLVDSRGHLFVSPDIEVGSSYEYIYREANGLCWNRSLRAIHAYEPDRWEHTELLRHIAATLAEAYEEELQFTEATTWQGVPIELQAKLRTTVRQE